MMELKKAQKRKVRLKIGISGPSGFGKTYSALLLAYGVTGDWSKIAVIDSENRSASLYSDLGEYNTIELTPPFSPERYIEAIKTCTNAGIEVIIVDSITHEWDGEGGCLEIHEKLGGQYMHWKSVTPRHNAFIQAILQCPAHIITTVRRKQDYSMVQDGGKMKVIKAGLKEVTREGFEYELTLNFDLVNDKHLVQASKDRTGLFMDQPEFIITPETGKKLLNWANGGVDEIEYVTSAIRSVSNRQELETVYANNTHLSQEPRIVEALKEMGKKYPKGE